jgi:hypothetical protein
MYPIVEYGVPRTEKAIVEYGVPRTVGEGFINMLEFRLKRVLKPKSVGRPPKKNGECP